MVYSLDLCIQNIGTGFARDVKFVRDFSWLHPHPGESLAEYNIIKNRISHLGPGKRCQIVLFWQYNKSDLPERILDVIVTYRDSSNVRYDATFHLDFTRVEGYPQIEDPSIESIARSLQRIDNTLLDMKNQRDSVNGQN